MPVQREESIPLLISISILNNFTTTWKAIGFWNSFHQKPSALSLQYAELLSWNVRSPAGSVVAVCSAPLLPP